jgi:hypothetical protein
MRSNGAKLRATVRVSLLVEDSIKFLKVKGVLADAQPFVREGHHNPSGV